MLLLLISISHFLLSTLLLTLLVRSHFPCFFRNGCLTVLCCSLLAWMSEVEVAMDRGSRAEASLARMEMMLSDTQNTVAAMQETIARVELMMAGKENSTTTRDDDSTSNEEEDEMRNAAGIEARWWKRQKK